MLTFKSSTPGIGSTGLGAGTSGAGLGAGEGKKEHPPANRINTPMAKNNCFNLCLFFIHSTSVIV
ncbi:hypothetical protein PIPA1_18710 [Pelosinus sp. IPA-1]|nr:hypothetical protein PIPA1_18710 [Pelosinus sp. IPA-1]